MGETQQQAGCLYHVTQIKVRLQRHRITLSTIYMYVELDLHIKVPLLPMELFIAEGKTWYFKNCDGFGGDWVVLRGCLLHNL